MATFITDEEPWTGGRVSERVICVKADNPSPMTYVGTNSWIVAEPGSTSCVVLDPAPSGSQIRTILDTCVNEGLTIGAIVVTHDHPDHTEGVKELAQATQAPIYAFNQQVALDAEDGPVAVTECIDEGPFVPFEGAPAFEIYRLPGHSSDSLGLLLSEEKALFTGDVVFRHGPTVVFYPDGNLADYLNSLDVLQDLVTSGNVQRFYPGHGYPVDDPIRALHATREHRLERLDQVKQALAQGVEPEANALFDAVYVGVDERLRWASLRSIEAQLVYLRQDL